MRNITVKNAKKKLHIEKAKVEIRAIILRTCLRISFTLVASMVVYGLMNIFGFNSSNIPVLGYITQNWWPIFNFTVLLVTLFVPWEARAQKAANFYKNEHFANRILISLTDVEFYKPSKAEIQKKQNYWPNGEMYMRTLQEESFIEFFGFGKTVYTFDETNAHQPIKNDPLNELAAVKVDYNTWKRLVDHVKNQVSSLSKTGHLMRTLKIPVVEQQYTWVLTYEKPQKQSINRKYRIIMIRTDLLNAIKDKKMTWERFNGENDEFKFCFNKCDGPKCRNNAHLYWKTRWSILENLHRVNKDTGNTVESDPNENVRFLIGTINLAARKAGTGEARLPWDDWSSN